MTLIGNRPSLSESAPGSHVILATRSADLVKQVTAVLVNDETTLSAVSSFDEIEAIDVVPDILILDAATPELVSTRLLSRVRHRWLSILLIAIAVPSEAAAAELLDAGVDDVIEARSSWTYTTARLNAAARRTRTANAMLRRRLGDVVYDRDNRRVWCAGTEVEFAPRELAVLDALWMRAGELVRHESLQDYVWSGLDEGERSNRLEVYISYVRRKLQSSKEVTIQTIRGAGYRLIRKKDTETPWQRDDQ